jgi:hypothetical protein
MIYSGMEGLYRVATRAEADSHFAGFQRRWLDGLVERMTAREAAALVSAMPAFRLMSSVGPNDAYLLEYSGYQWRRPDSTRTSAWTDKPNTHLIDDDVDASYRGWAITCLRTTLETTMPCAHCVDGTVECERCGGEGDNCPVCWVGWTKCESCGGGMGLVFGVFATVSKDVDDWYWLEAIGYEDLLNPDYDYDVYPSGSILFRCDSMRGLLQAASSPEMQGFVAQRTEGGKGKKKTRPAGYN